jgi:hypothetical protein
MIRFCLLGLFPLGLLAAAASDTASFRRQGLADLTRAVERSHTQFARTGATRRVAGLRGQAWTLSAMTDLHRATGDVRWTTWAQEDLLARVDQPRDAEGRATPFVVSFRNLAVLHGGALPAGARPARRDGTREVGFSCASQLEYDGRILFAMPLNREMYQGPGDFRVAAIKDKMPRWHAVIPAP